MGFLSCKGSADVERAELHLLPIAFRQHCPAPAVPPTRPPYLSTHWGAGAAGQFYVSSSPEEGTRLDRAEAFPTHTDTRPAVNNSISQEHSSLLKLRKYQQENDLTNHVQFKVCQIGHSHAMPSLIIPSVLYYGRPQMNPGKLAKTGKFLSC